jgi:hypothetical protein
MNPSLRCKLLGALKKAGYQGPRNQEALQPMLNRLDGVDIMNMSSAELGPLLLGEDRLRSNHQALRSLEMPVSNPAPSPLLLMPPAPSIPRWAHDNWGYLDDLYHSNKISRQEYDQRKWRMSLRALGLYDRAERIERRLGNES